MKALEALGGKSCAGSNTAVSLLARTWGQWTLEMPAYSENSAKGLHLRLANGLEWALVATEPCAPWLQEFGRVMQLKSREIDSLPKILFSPLNFCIDYDKFAGDGLGTSAPRTGWTCRDIGIMRFWTHPVSRDVVCELEPNASDHIDVLRMWFAVDIIYQEAVRFGGLPLHAGLMANDGFGVLLAGAGGAGKSTCCGQVPAPWKSPCDDEVLVVTDSAGEFSVHPFPTWSVHLWRGAAKTWEVQNHLPIKGIAFLRQAQQDRVHPLGPGEAAALINNSAEQVISRSLRGLSEQQSITLKRRVFDNACNLAPKVPVFALSVALNGTFWVEIEKALGL